MAGRKRLLSLVKREKGTLQKCRENPDAPTPPSELPKAPYLAGSERCSVIFGMIVSWLNSLGAASSVYTATITLLAMRLEEIEILSEDIRVNGPQYSKVELIEVPDPAHPGRTVTKAQMTKKANPAVAQRSEAMRHAQSLLAEVGLSPTSIGKIRGSGGGRQIDNPWLQFGNG